MTRKPKPGDAESEALKKEQRESGQPSTPPAREAIRKSEERDAERQSEEITGEKEPELNDER